MPGDDFVIARNDDWIGEAKSLDRWWSSKGAAFLILRPVPLQRMAELLGPSQRDRSASERKRFADELVAFDVNKPKRERAAGGI